MINSLHRRGELRLAAGLAVSLVLASSIPGVATATVVRITFAGLGPFSSDELDRAVHARLPRSSSAPGPALVGNADPTRDAPLSGAPGEVLVVVTADGGRSVLVRTGPKRQVVEVGDRRGASAARLVALIIADLIADELAPAGPLFDDGDAPSATPPAPSPDAAVSQEFDWERARPPAVFRLAATAGLSKGLGADQPYCYRAEVDAGQALAGRGLVIGGALGVVRIPTRDAGLSNELSFTAAVVRLWAGWRAGAFESAIGPFVSPYRVSGATDHGGVAAGAGALARLVTPMSARLRLVVTARADGYLNRIHTTWPGQGWFSTPRVEATLAAGLAWDVAR